MFAKIKNLDPNAKLVAKVVLYRVVLPVIAVAVTQVVINKIEKNQELTTE